MSFDIRTSILFRLANGHQQRAWEQGTAQSGVSGSHRTARVDPEGLKTQAAAFTAYASGMLPARVAHGRHKQGTEIIRHPQRIPLQT